MEAGDLIFVRGNSPISAIIKRLDGEFSHVALAVSPTHILESQRFVNTRITPIYFEDYEVVRLEMTEEQRMTLIKTSIQMTGRKYDYLQLIGIALEKIFSFRKKGFMNSPDLYICSEVVDAILYISGILAEDEFLGDKTPNELYAYIRDYRK